MRKMGKVVGCAFMVSLLAGFAVSSQALTLQSAASPSAAAGDPSGAIVRVAEGCGPGGWRGPWGHCRYTPFSGRMPGGGYASGYNGCPPGSWRGPWGNCRNTPFHGRHPNGAWY
jgi:hypothetical protein